MGSLDPVHHDTWTPAELADRRPRQMSGDAQLAVIAAAIGGRGPDRGWMVDAACRGMNPNLFHPERGNRGGGHAAQRVCATCPVKARCLDYGTEVGSLAVGIWGGQSARDRKTAAITRRLAAEGKATTCRVDGCERPIAYPLKGLCTRCRNHHSTGKATP
jgi:WhiB family redox-sensing transcriptional regulator